MTAPNVRAYYDPQTGEIVPLTIIAERYGALVAAAVQRTPTGMQGAADLPGLRAFGAKCPGCGCSVGAEGEVCPTCVQKPAFAPRAMIAVGEQPEPAYVTKRRAEQAATGSVVATDELPAGTVIGGATNDGY